jgi:hypothetical protein
VFSADQVGNLSRRSFVRGLLAGVAAVAIGARLAPPAPQLDLTEDNVEFVAATLRYKSTERFSTSWDDWRVVYGTPGENFDVRR